MAAPPRFNPRPPISQRATPLGASAAPLRQVSIHARQFHSGRRVSDPSAREGQQVSIHARQFHSGRPRRLGISAQRVSFQSTPANFTAGDVASSPGAPRVAPVSIHARQFHSGRPVADAIAEGWTAVSIHARQFHSGRLGSDGVVALCHVSFNPRPPISQRATLVIGPLRTHGLVSIHARQFHSGRPYSTCWTAKIVEFQSTPANFTAGDNTLFIQDVNMVLFQSTPANFTAGDAHAQVVGRVELVSIHARQFHSGRQSA